MPEGTLLKNHIRLIDMSVIEARSTLHTFFCFFMQIKLFIAYIADVWLCKLSLVPKKITGTESTIISNQNQLVKHELVHQ